MKAGSISVTFHEAQADVIRTDHFQNHPSEEVYCACKMDDYGQLCTETREMRESIIQWDDEVLTFSVGPDDESSGRRLQLLLYKQSGQRDKELLGAGSFCIGDMDEGEKRDFNVQLVDKIGKHCGRVSVTIRFFPSRVAAKGRDELGREYIDTLLLKKGVKGGSVELNARSPKSSPRATNRSKSLSGELTAGDSP